MQCGTSFVNKYFKSGTSELLIRVAVHTKDEM